MGDVFKSKYDTSRTKYRWHGGLMASTVTHTAIRFWFESRFGPLSVKFASSSPVCMSSHSPKTYFGLGDSKLAIDVKG